MVKNINEQGPGGGGDLPEAVTAAMFEALCVDWRDGAAKMVVFMADAGPWQCSFPFSLLCCPGHLAAHNLSACVRFPLATLSLAIPTITAGEETKV
jgi:hypothetical protein